MKKLIFAFYIAIFFITGCDKNKNNQILITNNYNAIVAPIFIPNNQPTIKQKIIASSLTDNKVTYVIIESNKDGLIEKILTDDESQNISINYREKTIHYSGIDAMLELDKHHNITAILGKNDEQLASFSYNKLGQLVKQENIILSTKEKRLQAFGYHNNKTVRYMNLQEKFFNQVTFYYNQKGEIIESISVNYIITDDKSKTDTSPKPDLNSKYSDNKSEKLKPNAIKCIYQNHNEYGDWRNAYCITSNEVRISTYTRELTY